MGKAAVANQILSGDRPRDWLVQTPQQIAENAKRQHQYWLLFAVPAAPPFGRAVFRLPSRDYPFLITEATTNMPVSSLRLFSTDNEMTTQSVPLYAVAGGTDQARHRFTWQVPLLLLPRAVWRIELDFNFPPIGAPSQIIFGGTKLLDEK